MTDTTSDLLMSVARSLRRRFGVALTEWDVTPAQSRALRLVCEMHTARLSVLADHLHIAPRSVTEVVDALEARGLVVRRPDPHDRRATSVVPTDEGVRLVGIIDEARRDQSELFLARLDDTDRRDLRRILTVLSEE